jgi:hypothetical protein
MHLKKEIRSQMLCPEIQKELTKACAEEVMSDYGFD